MKTLLTVLIATYLAFMWTIATIVKCIGLDDMSWVDVLISPVMFWIW